MAKPMAETVKSQRGASAEQKEHLNDLARLYLVREFLISELSNERVTLS